MSQTSFASRLYYMSGEAERRTTREMWAARAEQPLLSRLGKCGLGFLLHNEALRSVAQTRQRRFIGNRAVLGAGCEQIVVAEDGHVLKYLRDTLGVTRLQAEDIAGSLQANADTCAEYLADQWLPTTFGVEQIPSGKAAVVARQPRLEGVTFYNTAFDVVKSDSSRELADRITALHVDTGLFPDLVGYKNIAHIPDTDRLCIVDTIAVDQATQQTVQLGEKMTVGEMIEDRLVALRG